MADLALGAEPGSDGLTHGRDPRSMTQDDFRRLGHEPMSPLQAIRAHCLDCCAGSDVEVRKCMALRCPSWPFRMGISPWKAQRVLSEKQREAARERGRAMAAKRHGAVGGLDKLTSGASGPA